MSKRHSSVVLYVTLSVCFVLSYNHLPHNGFRFCVHALALGGSSNGNPKRSKPVRSIAIIGTGISGLSVAHALVNSPSLREKYNQAAAVDAAAFDISLFDSRSSLNPKAGAGIQLNGGLAVLGKINPALQRAVMEAGLPQTGVRSRCKPWFANEKKEYDQLLELQLRDLVINEGGAVAESLIDEQGQLLWTSIMRGALQETLFQTLPDGAKQKIQFDKPLIDIQPVNDDKSSGFLCYFADGSCQGPFDVIVGCDGIKSACKEYMETGKISRDASQREGSAAAIYSGLRIRYAVVDGDSNQSPQEEKFAILTQYFGNGAYALDGIYGTGAGKPNAKCGFIVYLDTDYVGPFRKGKTSEKAETNPSGNKLDPSDENADWTQNVQQSLDTREIMLKDIRRYGIPAGVFSELITKADRFFDLGIYFHNPFSLVGWSKEIKQRGASGGGGSSSGCIVLCGDAAHALPPFLGQGSNQAIQDAYCLASQIYKYNQLVEQQEQGQALDHGEADPPPSLAKLFKEYERVRWPATFGIFWKAAFLGYLETGGEDGFYSKFRDVFFRTMGLIGVAKRVLLSAAAPKIE